MSLNSDKPAAKVATPFSHVVPEAEPGIHVTASRAQHAPQEDRHGIFSPLSKASTNEDFALRLRRFIMRPVRFLSARDRARGVEEQPEAAQKRRFLCLLFGQKGFDGRRGVFRSASDRSTFIRRLKSNAIPAKHLRLVLNRIFSWVNRSAGSNLAGIPLVYLDRNAQGIQVAYDQSIPAQFESDWQIGREAGRNTLALSAVRVRIGEPYAGGMVHAAQKVADRIDLLALRLDAYVADQAKAGRTTVPEAELVRVACERMDAWRRQPECVPRNWASRTVLQMDFFFVPPRELRIQLLQDAARHGGFLSAECRRLLQTATENGDLRLAILDVSAGAFGAGTSELIGTRLGLPTAGTLDAYIDSCLQRFEAEAGRPPANVLVCPRRADMTLAAFEYVPLLDQLRRRGLQAALLYAEDLDNALEKWDGKGPFPIQPAAGQAVAPELVLKRFTFLGEQRGKGRGYVRTRLPEGMMITPSPASRVIASNKRINSRVLEGIRSVLAELGVDVIPTGEFRLTAGDSGPNEDSIQQAAEGILAFGRRHAEHWPEINALGLVLKLDDKHAGSDGDLVSAYPVPASLFRLEAAAQAEVRAHCRETLTHTLSDLAGKGIEHVVVQPNALAMIADGKLFLETKLMTLALRSAAAANPATLGLNQHR